MSKQKQAPLISLTWGLDDASLVRLGGVAVALPVCQPLHHLAALSRSSLTARSFAPAVCNEAAPKGSEGWGERRAFIGLLVVRVT